MCIRFFRRIYFLSTWSRFIRRSPARNYTASRIHLFDRVLCVCTQKKKKLNDASAYLLDRSYREWTTRRGEVGNKLELEHFKPWCLSSTSIGQPKIIVSLGPYFMSYTYDESVWGSRSAYSLDDVDFLVAIVR